jgi:hypothetical protein
MYGQKKAAALNMQMTWAMRAANGACDAASARLATVKPAKIPTTSMPEPSIRAGCPQQNFQVRPTPISGAPEIKSANQPLAMCVLLNANRIAYRPAGDQRCQATDVASRPTANRPTGQLHQPTGPGDVSPVEASSSALRWHGLG